MLTGKSHEPKNKKVLEAGSGAGRFTEILLKYGAVVDSFDYSSAVEANAKNNGHHDNLVLVQADIRKMPFPKDELRLRMYALGSCNILQTQKKASSVFGKWSGREGPWL